MPSQLAQGGDVTRDIANNLSGEAVMGTLTGVMSFADQVNASAASGCSICLTGRHAMAGLRILESLLPYFSLTRAEHTLR